MNDRDKLIELLKKADDIASKKLIMDYDDAIADNADCLLANGVIVPPCQVGDTVYYFVGNEIYHGTIDTFRIDTKENWYIAYCKTDYILTGQIKLAFWEFGKTVFLTKEEAEQKLKEVNSNDL